MLLGDKQFLIPWEGYDSISLYQQGVTYRRAKIKSVLILLQSFKDVFQRTECLNQLLDERELLQDNNINESLVPAELSRQGELIKQSIPILINFGKYLKELQNELGLQEKCVLPIPEQLQEIYSAIDCLEQLLKRQAVYNIDLLNTVPAINHKFTRTVKEILEKYNYPPSKEMAIEKLVKGKLTRITLGRYPELTVEMARREAQK